MGTWRRNQNNKKLMRDRIGNSHEIASEIIILLLIIIYRNIYI